MITKTTYKDRPAYRVTAGSLSVTVLPEDGGKLASIRTAGGRELLAERRPGEPYRRLTPDGSYIEAECGGFDDMFPTCDPWTPTDGPFCGITYPDHGETCRIPYEAFVDGDTLTLSAHSSLFPIAYRKTLSSVGSAVGVTYTFENEGEHPFPFLWAGHCMLAGDDEMRLVTSYPADAETTAMFCTPGYDAAALPKDRMSGFQPETGAAYKYYYLTPSLDGCFGIRYADGMLSFRVPRWKVPYLGVWINNGEFQSIYNMALEAATVPLDAPDRAAKAGYDVPVIPPKGTFTFTLILDWTARERETFR